VAEGILQASAITGYQLGTSKVFLRAGQMAMLDRKRTDKLNTAATLLQGHARGWLARKHCKEAQQLVVQMQVGLWRAGGGCSQARVPAAAVCVWQQ
jgi:myosin-5